MRSLINDYIYLYIKNPAYKASKFKHLKNQFHFSNIDCRSAHCVYRRKSYWSPIQDPARAYVCFRDNSATNPNFIQPTSITVRPDYNPYGLYNDIAIMRVPPLPMKKGKNRKYLFLRWQVGAQTTLSRYMGEEQPGLMEDSLTTPTGFCL